MGLPGNDGPIPIILTIRRVVCGPQPKRGVVASDEDIVVCTQIVEDAGAGRPVLVTEVPASVGL
jgi:hypothetical protein